MAVRDGGSGDRPMEEWSLTSHSSGQEPWILKLEELMRLQYDAGDDDGMAGELALTRS
jgi:hypothetical protein